MGKLLIIVILIVAALVTIISLSLRENRQEVPDETSHSLANIQAKSLSNEALNYGVKKLSDGSVNFSNNQATLTFNNFNVLDGAIDSIQFNRNNAGDSTMITAFVCYQNGDKTVHKSTSALVSMIPANVKSAVAANGEVIVKGNASVVGTITENSDPPLDFENIFGVSKAYVESIADYTYTNPPNNQSPCQNITWCNITSGSFKVTTTAWYGSGLLVIDGDADFSGGTFYGILWITGELRITGNLQVEGALFVEGGTEIAATVISGSPVISFSVPAIADFLGTTTFPTEIEYSVLSIFDE
ncbi:MAG: hypothetical protein Q7J16_04345 [Candidatus Cloacimonadales bacterium]|nr:hypothetical protein [Candidatus Cloacimonadales bacterium]